MTMFKSQTSIKSSRNVYMSMVRKNHISRILLYRLDSEKIEYTVFITWLTLHGDYEVLKSRILLSDETCMVVQLQE